MTRGAPPLTVKQKDIIKEHMGKMFPVNICKMDGMEGTTKRQVADYIRSMPERVDAELVIWTLETWIETHGLKVDYSSGVMKFLRDLRNRG